MLLFALACSDYDLHRDEDVQGTTEEETSIGQPGPDIEVSPTSLDFENVPVNCEHTAWITVTSVGEAPLTVSSVHVEGDATAWSSGDLDLVLEPGESAEVEVAFTPDAEASFTGRIVVTSDDDEDPAVGVETVGVGVGAGRYEESFAQEAQGAVDVLWVLDNSESMSPYVDHLGETFEDFIDPFLALGDVDWQLAVITTDMSDSHMQGRIQGEIITPATPNPRDTFLRNAETGAAGSNTERGFDAVVAALSEPLVSGANAGFLRPDARLAVIEVTDEDDNSANTSADELVGFLHGLKSRDDLASFSAFCGDATGSYFSPGCSEWVNGSLLVAGSADDIHEVIDGTGGVWASICSLDFSEALMLMSLEALGMSHVFELTAVPSTVNTMTVEVNGAEVDYDNEHGWMFDWDANAVVFYGDAIPGAGSTIDVAYDIEGGC